MQQKKHDPAVFHAHLGFNSKTNTEKGRLRKHVFALTVLSAALWSASAAAQYVEPGLPGNPTSWETDEYKKSWGVGAMKASSAYAKGFNGSGVKVGVMDSGALSTHQEFDPARFTYVSQSGNYGTNGMRYRGAGYTVTNAGAPFTAGTPFNVTGAYDSAINDNHGTSVTGIVGANRDNTPTIVNPNNMHGIAWGANIIAGNTGATDNNNYGPYQDYEFFKKGWGAMVAAGAQVINNSWGTNVRINMQGPSTVTNGSVKGADLGDIGNMLPTRNLADVEYEYFYFKKMYGSSPSFVDAAYEVVKDTPKKVVQIMTTGNRDLESPFHRALYPYFHPEAESQWVAVAGIKPDDAVTNHLILQGQYNEAGLAKWWTVVGPTLSGSLVGQNPGMTMWTTRLDTSPFPANGAYAGFSGTSCSAPHIAGAMGVLLSRYPYMTSSQVRDVMFTTATNKNADNSPFALWTAAAGVPDIRYGWGLPDLDKGTEGPAQFLGRFEYNLPSGAEDTWTNDISQTAALARKAEDQAWLASYDPSASNQFGLGPYSLGDTFVVADNDADDTNHIIAQTDAEAWRLEYANKRAAFIQDKLDNDLYDASLVKQGAGKLVMTGTNTFAGLTAAGGVTELDGNNNLTADTVIQSGGTIQVNKEAATTPPKNGVLISPLVDIRAGGTLAGNGDICDPAGLITPCSVANAGTITPRGSATHSGPADINTLTIHGDYAGAPGGRIVLSGVLDGDNSVLDKVVIDGTASGTTTIVLKPLPGSTGALTTGVVVGVVTNGGAGIFQTAPYTINGVTYTVTQQGNNMVLQGVMATNVAIPTVNGGVLGVIGVLLAGLATAVLRRKSA